MGQSLKVGIVGCGVAGAMTALLLRRAGHSVTLFERAGKVGPVGAGILLQPSGQAVLSRAGLLEKVVANAEPVERLHAITHRGRLLTDLPYGEVSPGCLAYGLHRGDLFAVLHEEILRIGVDLRLGQMVESANDKRIVDFDLIVAADGSRSAMRSSSSLRKSVYTYPHAAIWAVGMCQAIYRKLYQVTHGTRHLCGLLPTGGGRCTLFWSIPTIHEQAFRDSSFNIWREQVLALCPEAAEIFETVKSHADLVITGYRHVRMPCWHDGRMVIIGDAAHAMSPHLGQGVNLALVDAECLAKCVVGASDIPAALIRYDNARRRQSNFYSKVTRMLSPFFQSRGFIKGIGRDLFLPILPHLPIVRRQMLRTMAGLKEGCFG